MTTLTASSTLRFTGTGSDWQALATFDREAEAQAFAARFPKSAGLSVHGANVSARAPLTGNVANGGTNESGIVRYRRLVARAQKLGVTLTWGTTGPGFRHEVLSQAEFDALIGAALIDPAGAPA
ncbi:hypothetical protein [Mycolicibacterium tusciae]|uniref:hypothetical protein n=1 Tax=Mycolicibacterium tusciae TaxID=75922 RepID=UPI00024A367E|nr:hypothetical protein [Mycolicibacterium tusciae]